VKIQLTKITVTLLHCLAPQAALLGEAAMRRKDQGSRWGEDPKSGAGHPPVLQLILPPYTNWSGFNAHAAKLAICRSQSYFK
jgi:hypothetical protein